MESTHILVLCLAAFFAGAVNSIAGGGTLLTFPALQWVLGPSAQASVIANATSTVALFPGSIAGMWGYRRELAGSRHWLTPLLFPSLAFGAVGTFLVSHRDPAEFQILVPWLILIATVLFLGQPWITRWTGIGKPHKEPSAKSKLGIVAFQSLIALYGGYFGAGIGILMLSALALMGMSDIHRMNGVKTTLASVINGVSVVLFIVFSKVDWSLAWPMLIAAIFGSLLGASVARRMNRNVVRYAVVAIGLFLAGYYFLR